MPCAIVTGGHGFIGRHVVDALQAVGWEAVAAGRPDHELPSDAFGALLDARRPDAIVHCATRASVPGSITDPHGDLAGSLLVLSALLEALDRRALRPAILLVSSAAVYGQPARLPISEADPVAPISPYGLHRAMCETLLAERASRQGLPHVSARVFSAYGAGLHRQLLWDICHQAATDGHIHLDGTGEETRDFLHVADVARALVAILERDPMDGRAVNVASGEATTTRALAEILAAEVGLDADRIGFSGTPRPGDPRAWRANVARLAALSFTPDIDLVDGVRGYGAWALGELRSAALEA